MTWDHIESKWALMTRRIRADWRGEKTDMSESNLRSTKQRDTTAPDPAGSKTSVKTNTDFNTSAK
jgi:hypothetical protein